MVQSYLKFQKETYFPFFFIQIVRSHRYRNFPEQKCTISMKQSEEIHFFCSPDMVIGAFRSLNSVPGRAVTYKMSATAIPRRRARVCGSLNFKRQSRWENYWPPESGDLVESTLLLPGRRPNFVHLSILRLYKRCWTNVPVVKN